MPLSRLSPRSHRTGLSRGKRNAGPQSHQSSRHLRLWEAIRSTRDELNRLRVRTEQIENLFGEWIAPRETRLAESVADLTASLIGSITAPNRTDADRSLIGLWIIQNFEAMHQHPFAVESQWKSLFTEFSDALDESNAIDSQLIKLSRHRAPGDSGFDPTDVQSSDSYEKSLFDNDVSELDEEDVIFDFGWHKSESRSNSKAESKSSNTDNAAAGNNSQTTADDDNDSEIPEESALNEKIDSLRSNLSVNALFRQLAKVLHPDRELDEKRKVEKHRLMSECLTARQNKDIDRLLELYCEHVGDLPEGLTDNSHEELISALELQLKQLQRQFRTERFGESFRTQIYERYSDSNEDLMQLNVSKHARDLDQEISKVKSITGQLNSEEGFRKALLERKAIEQNRMDIDQLTGF